MRASKLCHSVARVFSPCVLFYCLQAALDTIAFNGHGTAAESLWAAIPVVILPLPGGSITCTSGGGVSGSRGSSAYPGRGRLVLNSSLALREQCRWGCGRQRRVAVEEDGGGDLLGEGGVSAAKGKGEGGHWHEE